MTMQDYLRVLREQWLVLLVAVLLGIASAAVIFLIRPAEYTAKVTMYVSSQGGDSTSAAYQGAQLSQQRVTSYVELVRSQRVAEEVIANLRLPVSADELMRHITASSAPDSILIDVSVEDASPASAAAVANAVADAFTELVDDLERPVSATATQAVAVRVVQTATEPAAPSSIGFPLTLVLGLLGGLSIGVASALARNAIDTSVKSLEQLRTATGVPNLGTIANDPMIPKRPLTVHENPQSPRAEAFRQLRTNLQFVDVDNPPKVLVVTSSLPSEGKTTTTTNLAIALALAGSRLLLIEGDLRRPKLADILGLESAVGLTNVLSGQTNLEQVIQSWGGGMFDVLASGPLPPNPSELMASANMKAILADVRKNYDVVLIDTPPLLPVTDAAAVAPATDGAILICRYRQTGRGQVAAAAAALAAVSAPLLGTVFTRTPPRNSQAYGQYGSYYGPQASARPEYGLDRTPATGDVTHMASAASVPAQPHFSAEPLGRRPARGRK